LSIRLTPKITFFLDPSIAEGTRMVHLLNTLEQSERKEKDDNDDSGTSSDK
jgi:ribosome-binding factor A